MQRLLGNSIPFRVSESVTPPSVPCIGILNNRDYIAYVPTGAWDNTRSKKDACLIVASPKLLSSLRKVVDHFSSRAEQNTRALEIIEEARALIKEAEGSDVQPQ